MQYLAPKSRKKSGGGKVTPVDDHMEDMVDFSKLFCGKKFGQGAHSRVYQGLYMDDPVALKMIIVPDDDEKLCARLEQQFVREVALLSKLRHQNLIKFIGAFRKPGVLCIITEYMAEGSLRSYMNEQKSLLPLPKLISMALEIARGMAYIHSQGIIHRDLKPENILITRDFHLKVADFGIACEGPYCDSHTEGTYRWMAPEMIKGKRSCGRKVDVYAFGLILWELLSGTIPYQDMTPVQAAFAVVNKNMRPVVPRDCAPAMKALIEQCWSQQPEKRPEFWQIVKVLQEFESSIALHGTLNLLQNPTFHHPKKGMLHWIHKLLGHKISSMPEPKFT